MPDVLDKLKETVSNVADKVGEAASSLAQQAEKATAEAADKVAEAASQVTDKLSSTAEQAVQSASHSSQNNNNNIAKESRVFVFDFDKTITQNHTSGKVGLSKLTDANIEANLACKESFKNFTKQALNNGDKVAIASFADRRMADNAMAKKREAGDNSQLIGGEDLIRRYLDVVFKDEPDAAKIRDNIHIEAFYPGYDNLPENKNKHIENIIAASGVKPENVILFDDSKPNVDAAQQAGYHAQHVDNSKDEQSLNKILTERLNNDFTSVTAVAPLAAAKVDNPSNQAGASHAKQSSAFAASSMSPPAPEEDIYKEPEDSQDWSEAKPSASPISPQVDPSHLEQPSQSDNPNARIPEGFKWPVQPSAPPMEPQTDAFHTEQQPALSAAVPSANNFSQQNEAKGAVPTMGSFSNMQQRATPTLHNLLAALLAPSPRWTKHNESKAIKAIMEQGCLWLLPNIPITAERAANAASEVTQIAHYQEHLEGPHFIHITLDNNCNISIHKTTGTILAENTEPETLAAISDITKIYGLKPDAYSIVAGDNTAMTVEDVKNALKTEQFYAAEAYAA